MSEMSKPGVGVTVLMPEPDGEEASLRSHQIRRCLFRNLLMRIRSNLEIVDDLQKVEDVFAHFNPAVDVDLGQKRTAQVPKKISSLVAWVILMQKSYQSKRILKKPQPGNMIFMSRSSSSSSQINLWQM